MPIYEYKCKACQNRFEQLKPVSKSSEGATCPKCKGKADRVLSRFASFSKGEGGELSPISGSGSSCGSCSSGSCSSCGG